MYTIARNPELGALLMKTTLIIWDEIPAQHKHYFEAVS
jgi:hypothetical protein